MPDEILKPHPIEAGAALRALPMLSPPRSAWPDLQSALAHSAPEMRMPQRWHWLAAAALLALALALPRWMTPPGVVENSVPVVAAESLEAAELRALMAESAQLEALIAWNREGAVESGAAASLGAAVQDRIQQLDALLARIDSDPDARLPLWQERVLRLRQLAGLDSTQQWLAANGDADQGVPVLAF